MIVTRYSYNVPQLGRALGAVKNPWAVPIMLGGAVAVGLLGIAYLEYSQGWRPFGRTQRAW